MGESKGRRNGQGKELEVSEGEDEDRKDNGGEDIKHQMDLKRKGINVDKRDKEGISGGRDGASKRQGR